MTDRGVKNWLKMFPKTPRPDSLCAQSPCEKLENFTISQTDNFFGMKSTNANTRNDREKTSFQPSEKKLLFRKAKQAEKRFSRIIICHFSPGFRLRRAMPRPGRRNDGVSPKTSGDPGRAENINQS